MAKTDERERYRSDAGKRVKLIREARGLTQTELALKAKITQGQISAIERGDRGMPPDQRKDIALALEVDPAVLDPVVMPEFDFGGTARQPGGVLNATSVPDRRVSSAGISLESFLERHPEVARRKRIRWYLENTGFKLEPWVEPDDRFWLGQVEFWEKYLAEVDAEGGTEGPKPPRKSNR